MCLEGKSSSSRTSSNRFWVPNRSKESRVWIGEDGMDAEEAEDFEE